MTQIASTSSPTALPSSSGPVSTPQRSRLSRKGKEKAVYTPPSYDFDDLSQGLYQPRSGQLQRKKTPRLKSKLSSPAAGGTSTTKGRRRKSNAEGVLGVETITIGAAVEKDLEGQRDAVEEPRRKKRKRLPSSSSKRLQPFPEEEPDPSSQADPSSPSTSFRSSERRDKTTLDEKEQRKLAKKQKKTVRLELPAPIPSTSSSSDNEYGPGDNDTFRLDSEDDRADHARPYGVSTTSPVRIRRRLRSSGIDGTGDDDDTRAFRDQDAAEVQDDPLLDYSNPLNLPRTSLGNQQQRTSRKYWRGLEYGVYRSAMYDAVEGEHGENDLGKLVWGWENLVHERRKVERELDGAEGRDEREGRAWGKKEKRRPGRPRLPRAGLDSKERESSGTATPRIRRRTRSGTGYSSGAGIGDEEDETGEGVNDQANDEDDDDEFKLELPTSQVLAQMARWPLFPAELMDYSFQAGQRNDLHEELEILAEQTRRETRRAAPEPLARRRSTRKIPSAYSANGPLASTTDHAPDSELECTSSDAESDFSTASLSPPPVYPPSFLQIPSTISSVLMRLSDIVPKEPLPPMDIWSVRLREEAMRLEREARAAKDETDTQGETSEPVTTKGELVPGWKEVVAVARENESIPKEVVDTLELRLQEMYQGKLKEVPCEPMTLPPVGGEPAFPEFEPRKKKPRTRKKRSEAVSAGPDGPTDHFLTTTEDSIEQGGVNVGDQRAVTQVENSGCLSQPDGGMVANELGSEEDVVMDALEESVAVVGH